MLFNKRYSIVLRAISVLLIHAFLLSNLAGADDLSLSPQTTYKPTADRLAIASKNDDILGQVRQDKEQIEMALHAAIKALSYKDGDRINIEAVVARTQGHIIRNVSSFLGLQLFMFEASNNTIMCRFREPSIFRRDGGLFKTGPAMLPRTYYAVLPEIIGANGEISINVFQEQEEIIQQTNIEVDHRFPSWMSTAHPLIKQRLARALNRIFKIPEVSGVGFSAKVNGRNHLVDVGVEDRYKRLERQYHMLETLYERWPAILLDRVQGWGSEHVGEICDKAATRYGQSLDYLSIYRRLIAEGILDPERVKRILDLGQGSWYYAYTFPLAFPEFESAFGIDANGGEEDMFHKLWAPLFGFETHEGKLDTTDRFIVSNDERSGNDMRNIEDNEWLKGYVADNGKFSLVLCQTYLPYEQPPHAKKSAPYSAPYKKGDPYKLFVNISRLLEQGGKFIFMVKEMDIDGNPYLEAMYDTLKKVKHIELRDWHIDIGAFGVVAPEELRILVVDQA